MMPETVQLLAAFEAAIQKAKAVLERHEYQGSPRTYVALGFVSQLLEHHDAVLLLIRHEMLGTTFLLTRTTVEGMFRALWLDYCASDEQVEEFVRTDKFPLKPAVAVAAAVDKRFKTNGYFKRLHTRTWTLLNSLTHTGRAQLVHRFTGFLTKPSYTDKHIVQATHAINTCTLILISKFLAARGHMTDGEEVEHLLTAM